MATILDGKKLSIEIQERLRGVVQTHNLKARLDVISVGNDPASQVYVRNKAKAAEFIGIEFKHWILDERSSTAEVQKLIWTLNADPKVSGIIVQLPLPEHINAQTLIQAINLYKDVDGFTYVNQGKLINAEEGLRPCTPAGIIKLLKHYNVRIDGKHAVVIGRSNIVGRPVAEMLLRENATVTVCHSQTTLMQLGRILNDADIIVSAVGIPKFIRKDMIGFADVIVDVGMNRDEDGKLCGDFDRNCYDHCNFYTPVPGGVGPMTIAMLMENVTDRAFATRNFF